MSVHVISAVYRARLGGATRKLIAVKLADWADDEGGSIFPSVGRIARETETSESTVHRTIRDFVAEGILVVVKQGGGAHGNTNHYRLDLDKLSELPRTKEKTGAKVTPVENGTGVMVTPVTGAKVTPQGCHGDTQTVIEPSREETPSMPPQGGQLTPVGLFEEFWKAYPRNTGKHEAWCVWHRIVYGKPAKNDKTRQRKKAQPATAEQILAGALKFAAQAKAKGTEEDYLPHAKTWLNAARWADYEPASTAKPAGAAKTIVVKRETDPEAFAAWMAHYIGAGNHGAVRFMANQGVTQEATRLPPLS